MKSTFILKIDKHFYGDRFCMLLHTFACYLIRFTLIQRVKEAGFLKQCHLRYYLYLILLLCLMNWLKPKSLDQNWLAGIFVCRNTTMYQLKDWQTIENTIWTFSKSNVELRRLEGAPSAIVIISYPSLSNKASTRWQQCGETE